MEQILERHLNPAIHAEACPICGDSRIRVVVSDEDRSLLCCCSCGVNYVSPQPAREELSARFQGNGLRHRAEQESRFENNRELVLSRIARYIRQIKTGGDILDVGCATGYFLRRFFSEGNWRLWGIELSRELADKAAEGGISVYIGDVSEGQFGGQLFDVITVLDAFYYFPEPQIILSHLGSRLKRDGLLVLDLPFGRSRVWRGTSSLGRLLSGAERTLLQTSDHLYYYTPQSISIMAEQCGLIIQSIRPLPANAHSRHLRNGVYRAFSGLSMALNAVSASKIFLGPRFLVAAVRK